MNKLHRDIDKIDEKIFKLLKDRLSKAKQIVIVKKFCKDKVTNKDREDAILAKASSSEYLEYKDEIEAIYQTIFEQMKKLELEEINKECLNK